jgi:hypothetical protein
MTRGPCFKSSLRPTYDFPMINKPQKHLKSLLIVPSSHLAVYIGG